MKLLLFKANSDIIDITEAKNGLKWDGDKSRAYRTLGFNYQLTNNVKIDFEDGAALYGDNNVELFRGRVYKRDKNLKNMQSLTLFDQMYYLVKNKDSFTFKNKTASEIFVSMCLQFKIPYGVVAATSYKIPELIIANRDLYSTLKTALSIEYAQTGERFYIRDSGGKLQLLKRKERIHDWSLEVGKNIISASLSESVENIATQVKLTSKEGSTVETVISKDDTLIEKFGIVQYLETVSETLSRAKLLERAAVLLKEKGQVSKTFSITCLGNPDVLSGDAIYVRVPQFELAKTFYVDKDSHTFDKGKHTMQLTLTETLEI